MSVRTILYVLCFLPVLYPLFAARPLAILVVGLLCVAVLWLLGTWPLAAGGLWLASLLLAMRSAMVAGRDRSHRRLQEAIEALTFLGPRQSTSERVEATGRTNVGVRLGNIVPVDPRAPSGPQASGQAAGSTDT